MNNDEFDCPKHPGDHIDDCLDCWRTLCNEETETRKLCEKQISILESKLKDEKQKRLLAKDAYRYRIEDREKKISELATKDNRIWCGSGIKDAHAGWETNGGAFRCTGCGKEMDATFNIKRCNQRIIDRSTSFDDTGFD